MSQFAQIVERINAAARDPGACTPPVVEAYNATDIEGKRIINAITALEHKLGRRIRLDDEPAVATMAAEMKARSEAAKAKA